MAVDRHTDHLGVALFKFSLLFAESNDLCRTNKREIEWVEKKDHVFPFIIGKLDLFKRTIGHDGLSFKFRRRFRYQCCHFILLYL